MVLKPSDKAQISDRVEGVLLVDKPRGMTSHDVVDRVRKIARTRKVGHTGTLDPLAEGLLVLCIGSATRIAQFLTGLPKEYVGTIRLGAVSKREMRHFTFGTY